MAVQVAEQHPSAIARAVLFSRDTTFLLWVYLLALALALRAAVVLTLGDAPLNLDEIEYDRIAWNLVSGLGYTWFFDVPTVYRSPGYPGFLALVYLIFDPDYYIARVANIAVASLQAPLVAVLGSLTLGRKAGRLAAIIVALYVPIVFYSMALMSENLFYVLLLGSLILWLKLLSNPSYWLAAGAGLMFGAAILTRPDYSAFLLFLALFAAFRAKHHRGLWVRYAVVVSVALLVIAPWAVRNYQVTERFMPFDSRLGLNLHISFSEESDGWFYNPSDLLIEHEHLRHRTLFPHLNFYKFMQLVRLEERTYRDRWRLPLDIPDEVRTAKPALDVHMHDSGMQKAFSYIAENPLRSALLSFSKLAAFWGLEQRVYIFAYNNNIFGYLPVPLRLLLFVALLAPFPIITLLAVADNCFASRFTAERWLLLLPIVYFSGVHSVIFGDSRFHFILVPLIALMAAHALTNRREAVRAIWRQAGFSPREHFWRHTAFAVVCAAFIVIWIVGQLKAEEQWRAVFLPDAHLTYRMF